MRRSVIVAPLRTTIGRFGGTLGPLAADLMAIAIINVFLGRAGLETM